MKTRTWKEIWWDVKDVVMIEDDEDLLSTGCSMEGEDQLWSFGVGEAVVELGD